MSRKKIISLLVIVVLLGSMLTLWPDDRRQSREKVNNPQGWVQEEQQKWGEGEAEILSARERRQVFDWELMTEDELREHRGAIRRLTTEGERTAFRREHHKEMQARAGEQGLSLADFPE